MVTAARLVAPWAWLFLLAASPVHGIPAMMPGLTVLTARADLQVNVSSDGIVTVWNGNTTVAQGAATDGGGSGYNAPAVLWIIYCFLLGVPLVIGGLMLPRITTGVAIGLTVTVSMWAAFINTEPANDLPELVITLIPMLLFFPGFAFGLYEYGRLAGVILICIASGFSWGVRICMFAPNLAVKELWGSWLIGTAFALVNVCLIPHWERIAVAIGSASVGTFFVALGIDLFVNKQSGMSFGLRYAFDRNMYHYYAIVYHGWKPPVSTIVLMAVSLALIPIIAFAQYRFYPRLSFFRRPGNEHGETASILEEKEPPHIEVYRVIKARKVFAHSAPPSNDSLDSYWIARSRRQSTATTDRGSWRY
ncbi:hypothetical protein FOMPIDRAFT_1049725 [Fomitopsis schrenkii]|uniref:TM7S3/TM198-like domain-containing protein n=1 Tax=Fomitopsis schrenkii TaxID=2126942 RepID=S8FQ24_FOMSC|nr:hypothetical protein FOMPIDRAFT_1049725 [Fomitopsis schrenkii]